MSLFLFQAYCAPREWLVFNETGQGICETKSCPSSNRRRSKLVVTEVKLNGTGPCVALNEPSKHCSDPQATVHFRPYELTPKCGKPGLVPAPRIISPIKQQRCPPGSVLSFTGACQQSWSW